MNKKLLYLATLALVLSGPVAYAAPIDQNVAKPAAYTKTFNAVPVIMGANSYASTFEAMAAKAVTNDAKFGLLEVKTANSDTGAQYTYVTIDQAGTLTAVRISGFVNATLITGTAAFTSANVTFGTTVASASVLSIATDASNFRAGTALA